MARPAAPQGPCRATGREEAGEPMRNLRGWAVSAVVAVVLILAIGIVSGESSWPQFGGPKQDFKAASDGLAGSWPEAGPKKLWSRELGEGYSGILVDAGNLYTMYRSDGQEAVVALDAKTGETVWEHRYEMSPHEGHVSQFGEGPRATPLIVGDHIYTIGIAGTLKCLDKKNGKEVWAQELWGEELGGTFLSHGYSSSPIEYKSNIIALVGGEGASLVAFDKKTGKIAWKNLDFANSYSTPRLLDVDGELQLVTFMAHELIGVDPDGGTLKWSFPHENQWQQNINMPVMADKNTLFLSSPQAGARGLALTHKDGATEVEEIWSTRKIQFYHVTSVRDGQWVYGSTGTMGPAFMAAVNIKTGEIAWRERGIAKANVLAADGKLFVLDEDGKLYLTTATPEGLTVHSQAELLTGKAWTVPTIVGKTMFLRDQTNIMAVDLG
jgi:outer membrane protein assembly factor BamB